MKFDVEPSPDYIEHVSKADSDINKQLPSDIIKLDDGDRNMEDAMLDSADVEGLQSIDASQSHNDFKSCNVPGNINNHKNESVRRNSPCLSATSEIDLIAQEDPLYMDKAVCERVQFIENVSVESFEMHSLKESGMVIDETPERENSEDSKPSVTTPSLHSLGEVLQRNSGDREIAGPSDEYHADHGSSGSLIDERMQLDTRERIACMLPSEEIIELRSRNVEELKADIPRAENQDLSQKIDQVAEEEEDSTNMISKRPFGEEDVTASTSNLEAEDTSIVGNKNKVLNNQLSFQSQNDDVGTEEASNGDGTTPARTSFVRLVHGDSDLIGPSYLHGAIATSTHIPYSGNISFHSESSTTSTHSFAFPKLQAEWSNSSPVRMAKAKSRRLRKLRGWKSRLLCCKF